MATAETVLLVAGYTDLSIARQGFQAIRDLYYETRALDRMDAAVLARRQSGAPADVLTDYSAAEAGRPIAATSGLAIRLATAIAPGFAIDRASPASDVTPQVLWLARGVMVGLDPPTQRELTDVIAPSAAALLVVIEPSMLRPVQGIVADADRLGGAEIQIPLDAVRSGADPRPDTPDSEPDPPTIATNGSPS